MFPRKISILILVLVSGCASAPKLDQIPNGETVSIVVAESPTADRQSELINDTVGKDMGIGAGGGALSGVIYSGICGPFIMACLPIFATTGAAMGGVAGGVVSTTSDLSAEQATQLRDRVLRLNESHDQLAELASNINDRVASYWDLNSTDPQTRVWVWVQNLKFATARGDQVRAILQVNVMVLRKSDKPPGTVPVVWAYEYSSPFADLDEWLDDESDFADTSISSAILRVSSEIVSDLANSSSTGQTVQFAKVQPISSSNGTSSISEFYVEAMAEVDSNTYDKNLWDKALVEAGDDQTKREARYIELRANELYDEKLWAGPKLPSGNNFTSENTTGSAMVYDVSGIYTSNIDDASGSEFGRKHKREQVAIIQAGNKITGTFGSDGKIEGTIRGDAIVFDWYSSYIEGRGEWRIDSDRKGMTGKWQYKQSGHSGEWDLTRNAQAAIQQKSVVVESVKADNSVTGTYVSDITTNSNWRFNNQKHRSLVVQFEQNGNHIIGTCSSANLKILATREGDNITFYTLPSDISSDEIKGKWKVNADGSSIEGKWTHPHGNGKWNLTRIE
jgi:hypothetical protein